MRRTATMIPTCLILLSLLNPVLIAQDRPTQYPQDSQYLFALARDLWAPVELQVMGYAPASLESETTDRPIRQSCLYLQAATELASEYALAWQDLIPLLVSSAIDDPGRATDALATYSQLESENSYPVDLWLGYRLNHFNDRQSRETFLQGISGLLRDYPSSLSDTYTQLGFFAMERGDLESSRQLFNQAYAASPYNDEALAHLIALNSPASNQGETQKQSETTAQEKQQQQLQADLLTALRWRTRLHNNPEDIDALVQLIQTLDDFGAVELAQDYYRHAYRLIENNPQPDTELKHQLHLKQIVSSYSAQQFNLCQQLCETVIQTEPKNLLAAAMAIKLGTHQKDEAVDSSQLDSLVTAAWNKTPTSQDEQKALLEKITWFYCFVVPEPQKAMEFAQKLDDAAGKTPQSQALLALALLMNQQPKEAHTLLEPLESTDPITAIAWANLHLANKQPNLAREALYAINHRQIPNGLIAEQIETLFDATAAQEHETSLPQTPSDPLSPLDKRQQDVLQLKQTLSIFAGTDLDLPFAPEKTVRCFLRTVKHNDMAYYGDPILAQIYLSNVGQSDLVLGQGNFIDPDVLIFAEIPPLPANPSNPNDRILIAHRYLGQKRVLHAGQSNTVFEALNIGKVRQRLERHPQRSYRIRFHLCLDPISDGQGGFLGKIAAIKPETLTILRKGFKPTRRNMQRQFEAAAQGNPNSRLRAFHLLAGLLREAALAQTERLDYPVRSVDTQAIISLLRDQLTDPDFRIRAWSAHELSRLPKTQGVKLAGDLSRSLNDPHWFVQFMAAQTLESLTDMGDYHRWAAKLAKNELIQRQAQLQLDQTWSIIEPAPLNPQPDTQENRVEAD